MDHKQLLQPISCRKISSGSIRAVEIKIRDQEPPQNRVWIQGVDQRTAYKTRTSPPGAVGAVGHPFGQSRLVDRNALRALLSHGPSGRMGLRPTVSRCHILSLLSLGRTTFLRRNRSCTNPKNISRTVQSVLMTFPQSKVYTMGVNAPLICLWTASQTSWYRTDANSYTIICCSERKCPYGAITSFEKCCYFFTSIVSFPYFY